MYSAHSLKQSNFWSCRPFIPHRMRTNALSILDGVKHVTRCVKEDAVVMTLESHPSHLGSTPAEVPNLRLGKEISLMFSFLKQGHIFYESGYIYKLHKIVHLSIIVPPNYLTTYLCTRCTHNGHSLVYQRNEALPSTTIYSKITRNADTLPSLQVKRRDHRGTKTRLVSVSTRP